MTSLADKTLDELIDRVFSDDTWHAIRVFNGRHPISGGSTMACVARDHTTAMVDQLLHDARPSEKLRSLLLHALKLTLPHANPQKWDGAYTNDLSDEWLEEQQKLDDEFDDILG